MDTLKRSLSDVVRRIRGVPLVDEKAVEEITKDIQRALLKADVSVDTVVKISDDIKEKMRRETLPPGFSRRELLLKIVYEELVDLLGGEEKYEPKLKRTHLIMLVGIQGSGKTTVAAKLADYFRKKNHRPAMVCADNFRPGALQQLKQLGSMIQVTVYGEGGSKAVELAAEGLKKAREGGHDLIIIDTAGRHKEETGLIMEMKDIADEVSPDEVVLVLDATIGRQAGAQAKAFHEAAKIGSIIVTKLDGAAKGGGALAAVASSGAKISFISTGESMEDFEPFDPQRFINRLLGFGDVKALVDRFRSYEILSEKKAKIMAKGKFTLIDLLEQLESMQKMGPFRKLLDLIPGSLDLPDNVEEEGRRNIKRWTAIMHSMTLEELSNPAVIDKQRMYRIARGSGTTPKDVKDLLRGYRMTRKYLRKFARSKGRLPFPTRRSRSL